MQLGNRQASLEEFLEILERVDGVREIRVWRSDGRSWIGVRAGSPRPGAALLGQLAKAASGFGLDPSRLDFGLLAD